MSGSSDARILRNNCVIDQEVQFDDAYTFCQAHFPQPLATIREDQQIARAIADHRKLKSMSRNQDEYKNCELLLIYIEVFPYAPIVYLVRKMPPDGKISYVPLINVSNHFFDHDPQSRNDSRFLRRIPREHPTFYVEYRAEKGREEYSTVTCTALIMTGTPIKCGASAKESRDGGPKGLQKMFTYEHHRVVEVEYKGLACQALKQVGEMKMLELQECPLDDQLQKVQDDLHPALLDADVIQIGLKKSYDHLYKSKQRPHPGGMLDQQLADKWMHDENILLLHFENGCGRYQRQKYVGWTTNSWKLLETVSPEELASTVRLLQIEYGIHFRPHGNAMSSAVPIDDRVVYLSEIYDAQNNSHTSHDKCVYLIVCLADTRFLCYKEKIAPCMHRDKVISEHTVNE